ncbi:MAG: hypothetical protein HN703_10515, partial [Planctomycetaceae bacterium]|nr:hypothetical protein [Planctomycetaceae bacterium]
DELPPTKPFRVVEAGIIEDELPPQFSDQNVSVMQQQLLAAFKRSIPKMPTSYDQIDELLGSQITLGMLADIVAYTAELTLGIKLSLLKTSNVYDRVQVLLDVLGKSSQAGVASRTFPPAFSVN